MPEKSKKAPASGNLPVKEVSEYAYTATRKNNPEVGLVTPDTDPDGEKAKWSFDPHLAPELRFDPTARRARADALFAELAGLSGRITELSAAPGEETPEETAARLKELNETAAALQRANAELQAMSAPFLEWTGKAEKTSFEVDTVSLHVHEKIHPTRIIDALRSDETAKAPVQGDLFENAFRQESLREAVDFYNHDRGWSNRLVAGDSLLVMNSLLRKESMAGQVQMFYFDPPYGIKYGSNFQPFVNKRDVKDRTDSDLTQEPEMIKAFRDTWELGIHSYLAYLRDRLLLARELLHETGSVFVQISDENVHLVRNLMDEIFGVENFVRLLAFRKTGAQPSDIPAANFDFIVWYARKFDRLKSRRLFTPKDSSGSFVGQSLWIEDEQYSRRLATKAEKSDFPNVSGKRFFVAKAAQGAGPSGNTEKFELWGKSTKPGANKHWSTTPKGMDRLGKANRLVPSGSTSRFVWFFDDFPMSSFGSIWDDTVRSGFGDPQVYVVETNALVIERCLLMTTDPGDLVLDITCGSGTTAFVAEKWGRRWITCDTSRVALALAKQRLMTATFDYYALRYPNEGIRSGFIYETVPHITLKSIANNPEIDEIYDRLHPEVEKALAKLQTETKNAKLPEWEVPFEFPDDWPEGARAPFEAFHKARRTMQAQIDTSIAAHADSEILYDRPRSEKNKLRVTGPFTVEATPFPAVQSLEDAHAPPDASTAVARSGETSRQHQWRDELVKTGIRGKAGQNIAFVDLETVPGTRHLHAIGTTADGQPAAISFGPEHAPLEQRQVALALEEAMKLMPKPKFVVFASFTFDPEAAKDIDETNWPGVTLLKAQMNPDLLTDDLKKARASNESFWLMGQPDVVLRPIRSGADHGKWEVEVNGFDYFNTKTGELDSGGPGNIAMWLLDTDYDGRALLPRQVFFPMAGPKDGWSRLGKDLKAQLDEDKLDAFRGTTSLPFEPGENRRVAVKVVDDRGIESLKIISIEPESSE